MDVFKVDALLVIIYFVIPSFIAITVHDHIIPSEQRKWNDLLLSMICYGAFNFVLYSLLISAISHIISPMAIHFPVFEVAIDYRFFIFGCLLLPTLLGFVSGILPKSTFLLKKIFHGLILHPEPTAWDFLFSQRKRSFFVLFALKSGFKGAGLYSEKSYVSTYPQPQEIYLEEVWRVNNHGPWEKVERTAGTLLLRDECSYLEFIDAELASERISIWQRIRTTVSTGFKKVRHLLQRRLSRGKDEMVPSADQISSPQAGQVELSPSPQSPVQALKTMQVPLPVLKAPMEHLHQEQALENKEGQLQHNHREQEQVP